MQDMGEEPVDIEAIEKAGYLKLDEYTAKQWKYSFVGSNPFTQVWAVSTGEMKGGAGHTIIYDIRTGIFSGWGIPESK